MCRTFGGPPYAPGLSVNDWEQGLMNNLVAVDKQGDPIEFMITSAALPELPAPTVIEVGIAVDSLREGHIEHGESKHQMGMLQRFPYSIMPLYRARSNCHSLTF